jgi:hypothetical protein
MEKNQIRTTNPMSPLIERIDKKLVHKIFDDNVLIGDLQRVAESSDEFECQMIVDLSHHFFFEHPLDHIPGMMFVEAGRQAGIACSHLFLGIPFDTQFISRGCNVQFVDFGETHRPVKMRTRFKDTVHRKGTILEAHLETEFYQQERLVCSMTGDWKMYPREIYERFRSKQKPSGADH